MTQYDGLQTPYLHNMIFPNLALIKLMYQLSTQKTLNKPWIKQEDRFSQAFSTAGQVNRLGLFFEPWIPQMR